jgi:AcrR family transcriptional regulator
MAHVVSEHGVGSATVSRVVKRAGVSRRTFYELFDDRDDCFVAVLDDVLRRAGSVTGTAYETARGGWREQLRAGLGALLGFFEEEPFSGSLLVVDALGAGPKILERRARVLDALTTIVDQGRDEAKAGSSGPPPLTAEGVVGAVLSVIHARLLEHDRQSLLDLLNPLMGMIVLPYLGRAAARREQERPLPQPSRPETPGRPGARSGFSRPDRVPGPAPRDPLEGLNMRLTYRTLMVLAAIAADPGASNRQVAQVAGVHDQGQISKLLGRLEKLGLVHNGGNGQPRGEPNAWTLTLRGQEVAQAFGL